MKRLLLIPLILCVLLFLFSCGWLFPSSDETPHVHTWQETISRQATCQTEGKLVRTCSVCGATEETIVPKTEHVFSQPVVTLEATCGAEGVKTYTCSVCGFVKTETIPKTENHAFETVVTQAASCGEDGIETSVCSICGFTKTEVIPKTGEHEPESVVTKEATCAEEGVVTTRCAVCGEILGTETIEKTNDHDFVLEITKPATCAENGIGQYHCCLCGADGETVSIPKTSHTYQEKVIQPSTIAKNGVLEKKCTVCGHTETETLPLKEAKFVLKTELPLDVSYTYSSVNGTSSVGFRITRFEIVKGYDAYCARYSVTRLSGSDSVGKIRFTIRNTNGEEVVSGTAALLGTEVKINETRKGEKDLVTPAELESHDAGDGIFYVYVESFK